DASFSSDNVYSQFTVETYSAYADHQPTDGLSSRVEMGYSKIESADLGDTDPSLSLIENMKTFASWINTWTPHEQHQLVLGADWLKDEVANNLAKYEKSQRTNTGLFAQHSFHGERLHTELGARHDDNEQFGSQATWNAALGVSLT